MAVSLAEARGRRVPRAPFAVALWARLEQWLEVHADRGFAPVRAAWREMSSTLGQQVLVQTGERELQGVAEDIDDSGALILRTANGAAERIVAGDVQQIRSRR
jgi:BirA family biotin operon repressor/biotin-[acetyl-CoA-carboxylase] ligase